MINHLKNIPLFSSLKEEDFVSILENIEEVQHPVDVKIFETGDVGDCLYIISEGEVEVYIEGNKKSEKIILSTLKIGDYFGEMALITGESRSASVKTLTDCKLMRLSKNEFDQLIINNPTITISISHMLSQRLNNANIQRAEVESIYQSKMKPTGTLEDFPVFEVLKFCEQNSLTGLLNINNEKNHAELIFEKGQLQQVKFNKLVDDKAMDEILGWQQGFFQIEPSIMKIENQSIDEVTEIPLNNDDPIVAIEYFATQLIMTLITIVGSKNVKQLISKTNDLLISFFPNLEFIKTEISKNVNVSFTQPQNINEKDFLSMGVFLQVIIENCKKDTIGMSFLDLKKISGPYAQILQKISFFEYMTHAKEFVSH